MQNYYGQCEACGVAFEKGESQYIVDGDTFCLCCYDNATSVCSACGKRHYIDDMLWCVDQYICKKCTDSGMALGKK